ncbi:hypothetical protein [Fulvivirga kasyanovii]|uniref:hypothetical protein n=1 Tax=Fulvivirga kasyanovii TaxID=396812 RepID=UPI0031DDE3F9
MTINYAFDTSSQTHDYSNNWDFDGDKLTDSLLFIGNGGGHLYFNLKIILSSNNKAFDFPFLNSDMPSTSTIDQFYTYDSPLYPSFVAHDFDSDGRSELYFKNDKNFSPLPDSLINLGIVSNHLILDFIDNKFEIQDFDMKVRMRRLFGNIDSSWSHTYWPEDLPLNIAQKIETMSSYSVDDFIVFTVNSDSNIFALQPSGIFRLDENKVYFDRYEEVWSIETICYVLFINTRKISIIESNNSIDTEVDYDIDVDYFRLYCDDNGAANSFAKIIDFGRSLD